MRTVNIDRYESAYINSYSVMKNIELEIQLLKD